MRELNFDGLVGPTHNYGGLSRGNTASTQHGGQGSNPKEAALQGLLKARRVAALGVAQAVLPPHPRPSLRALRQLGFVGSDEQVLSRAAREAEHLLRLCSSAAAMWTANAATCIPSSDAADGRLHLIPANLLEMFHRAIEADTTTAVLRAIFRDEGRFVVHDPLPRTAHFADEGAANHLRLWTREGGAVHLFAWGRSAYQDVARPRIHPARQTLEASEALARLGQVPVERRFLPQQDPRGIDAGAFHTDVLAVGNESFLMLHEWAFEDAPNVLTELRARLGGQLSVCVASEAELPAADAVAAYPFNSQVVTLPDGTMAIVAPLESRERPAVRRFLERVVAEENPVQGIHYLDVRQSMQNGGGPACLRLRVQLADDEWPRLSARVLLDDALYDELSAWIGRHYRDRLYPADLGDPSLARESMTALDELTAILRLGSIYAFQQG